MTQQNISIFVINVMLLSISPIVWGVIKDAYKAKDYEVIPFCLVFFLVTVIPAIVFIAELFIGEDK